MGITTMPGRALPLWIVVLDERGTSASLDVKDVLAFSEAPFVLGILS
jgi:hypothetical protein